MKTSNKIGQWNIVSFTKNEVEQFALSLDKIKVASKMESLGKTSWLNLDFSKLLTQEEIEEIKTNERNIINIDHIFNGKKSISTKKLIMLICPQHKDYYKYLIS